MGAKAPLGFIRVGKWVRRKFQIVILLDWMNTWYEILESDTWWIILFDIWYLVPFSTWYLKHDVWSWISCIWYWISAVFWYFMSNNHNKFIYFHFMFILIYWVFSCWYIVYNIHHFIADTCDTWYFILDVLILISDTRVSMTWYLILCTCLCLTSEARYLIHINFHYTEHWA